MELAGATTYLLLPLCALERRHQNAPPQTLAGKYCTLPRRFLYLFFRFGMLLPLRFASQRPSSLLQELRSHLGACWKRGRVPKKSFQKDKWNGKSGTCLSSLLFGLHQGMPGTQIQFDRKGLVSLVYVDTKNEVREGFFHTSVVFGGSARFPFVTLTFKPPKTSRWTQKPLGIFRCG